MPRVPIIPDIYILHSGDASDQVLASTLAADFDGLQARSVLMTADELVARYLERGRLPVFGPLMGILPGPVIALLSETMLSEADRRVALLATVAGASLLDFRHNFLCVAVTPQAVR